MSQKSYKLLCKMFTAVRERTRDERESILGNGFMGYASGNIGDFKRQKQKRSTATDYKDYNGVDDSEKIH